MATLDMIKGDPEVQALVLAADRHLEAIGFTEHGLRHVGLVSSITHNLLKHLGYPERTADLGAIAAYLHDIGNAVSRHDHGQTSALLAYPILRRLGMPAEEAALVLGAIGNHEKESGSPVNVVSAALILADKSDVHRSRVRNQQKAQFDIHDRVNFAVQRSFLRANAEKQTVSLELTIDTSFSPLMEYFEIFLVRMVMCRRAAQYLGCSFELVMNGTRMA